MINSDSGGVRRDPEDLYQFVAAKKTNLEISFAVYNKQTSLWEEPHLEQEEKATLLNALDVIHQSGQVNEALKQEGAVLELTGNRIYAKDHEGQIQDLTSDLGYFSSTRSTIRRTLTEVARAVKSMTKEVGEEQVTLSLEDGIARREGGVVIKLRVVPSLERMMERVEESLKDDQSHAGKIEIARDLLLDQQWISFLKTQGCTEELIGRMQEKLGALYNAQAAVVNLLETVNQLMTEEQFLEALNSYNQLMPEAFKAYLKALGEWGLEQEVLREILGTDQEKNPFQLDLTIHARFQDGVARMLLQYAQKIFPDQIDLTGTQGSIGFYSSNYLENQTFYAAHAAEYAHFTELQWIMSELDKAKDILLSLGMVQEDLDIAKEKLAAVAVAEKKVVSIMGAVTDLLVEGKREEAATYYSKHMPVAHGAYCDALREWGPRQQLLEEFQENSFQVDFEHPQIQVMVSQNLLTDTETRIASQATSFAHTAQFIQFAQEQYTQFIKEERVFCDQISDVLDYVDIVLLLEGRFTRDESANYRQLLEALKRVSEENIKLLEQMQRFIDLGMIEEGIEHYNQVMRELMPLYRKALSDLVIPQRVATNRGRNLTTIALDLGRLGIHDQLLSSLSSKQTELELTRSDGGNVVDFTEARALVSSEKALFDESARFLAISDAFNAMKSGATIAGAIGFQATLGEFVENFVAHRESFEAIMRQEGFTDLETAAIFNQYVQTHQAFEVWFTGLQEAVDLANEKKYEDAIERFARLVQEEYVTLNGHVLNFLPFVGRFAEERIARALKRFGTDRGMHDPAQLPVILDINRYTSNIKMQVDDIQKAIEDSDIDEVEEFTRACTLIAEQVAENNTTVGKETRLYRQDARFMQFFNFSGAPDDPARRPTWQRVMKQEGWTTKEAEAFMRVYNKYAALILQLQEGELAVEREQDSVKRRALHSQLIQVGIRFRLKLGRLNEQFNKLGGYQRLQSLTRMAQEIGGDAGIAEARSLQELMHERRNFVEGFYERQHLYKPYEENTVVHTLLIEPHLDDPNFVRIFEERGWNIQNIQDFNDWFDAYNSVIHPIQLAEARLKEDPENILLQKEFQRIYSKQIKKVNRLTAQFKKQFGTLQKVKDLEWACAIYSNQAEREFGRLSGILEQSGGEMHKDEREEKFRQMEILEISVSMMQRVDFAGKIEKMDTFLSRITAFANQEMSWEEGYLSGLTDKNSLLAQELKKNLPEGLKLKDIRSIERLFGKYQDELRKINTLERKLEALPENARLRRELRNELQSHVRRVNDLNKQRKLLLNKIELLQEAIGKVKEEISAKLQKVTRSQYVVPQEGETVQLMERAVQLERSRSLGGYSDEEARALIAQCDRLDVVQAFHQKVEFMNDVYQRHGMTE